MFRKQSDSIAKFACAFNRAQEEMTGAKQRSTNPHFRSKYADLPAVMEAVMPALNRHGISVMQFPGFDPETKLVSVETLLVHNSGEWMSGTCLALPKDHKNVQAVGSTITYLKRYGLQSMTGCPSEDDDGNAASPPPRQRRARRQPPASAASSVTMQELRTRCGNMGLELQQVVEYLVDNKRASPMDMKRPQVESMFTWLNGDGADKVRSHIRPSEG
jgi:hypothetical protein